MRQLSTRDQMTLELSAIGHRIYGLQELVLMLYHSKIVSIM